MAKNGEIKLRMLLLLWATIPLCCVRVTGSQWGRNCSPECQCHETPLSHTNMASYIANSPAEPTSEITTWKAAVCIIGKNTLLQRFFKSVPTDTQVLTILQTEDAPVVILLGHQIERLRELLALEIHGHYQVNTDYPRQRYVPHFALGSDVPKALRHLRYLSLRGVDLTSVLDEDADKPRGRRSGIFPYSTLMSPSASSLSSSSFHYQNYQSPPFSKLHHLRSLTLRHNNLEVLPDNVFEGLTSLEDLSVTANSLTHIPPLMFADLSHLKRLSLAENRLYLLDAASFLNLETLEQLDLSDNNISDISILSFPILGKLTTLHLKGNPIRVVFLNAFHGLNRTQYLSLGDTTQPLHVMRLSFQGLLALRTLTIPNIDNDILERGSFEGLSSLETLTLHGRITAIGSSAFEGAHALTHADFSYCHIRRVNPKAFLGLKNLKSLDLSHNQLSKIPVDTFDPVQSLRELQLQNNNLHTLPAQLFVQLPHLHMLRLERNSWHCSCSMSSWNRTVIGRIKVVSAHKTCRAQTNGLSEVESPERKCKKYKIKYVKDLTLRPVCHGPPNLRGKKVLDVIRKDLKCSEVT